MNESVAIEMAIRARKELSAMDSTIRKVRKMKRRFANMARSVIGYAQKISAAVAKMKAAFIKLNNALRTLRNVALKAFTALVALTGIPIYKFAKFEQAMANVNTLLDTSSKKFRELQDGVISVSNRVGESAESLSTALYDIVSAGVDAGNSIGVLDLSARAATAGMTDTQTAVNAGIATVNAFNLEIQDLTKVFDLQFQTVRKGVITYEQLSNAQGELLPSARKLNESLENMYGSLAFVTKNGLSAEMASTSLARAYDGLIQKSSQLADAGVEVYNEFGKFRGIVDIVEDLSDRLEGLSDQKMQDVLQSIGFEIRAARAIIPMIKNVDGLRESVNAMSDSTGSMEDAFKKAANTISFRFNKAKERVTNSIIAIGRSFKTEINSMLDDIGAWALAIQNFVSENREAIKSILTFALRMTATVAVFATVGTALMSLLTPIGIVSTAMFAFGAAWYLNMWDIRDKTDKAISKIIELWGDLQESTKNTVDYSIKKWNELKEWWQNTTWIEKAQDIGKITLSIGQWGFESVNGAGESLWNWIVNEYDVNEDGSISLAESILPLIKISNWLWENVAGPILSSLWNWLTEKFDINSDGNITLNEALELTLKVSVAGFEKVGDIAGQFSDWIKNSIYNGSGSIEEQLESQTSNEGLGELLQAIYRAEGGANSSVPYGMTGFRDQGYQFALNSNQEFFEGMESALGLEAQSKEWFAAAAATTVTNYWELFKENYELKADQTLSDLSDKMQDKFIEYLGSNYAPSAAHELNQNWIPNVSDFYEENKQFSQAGEIATDIGVNFENAEVVIKATIEWTGETYQSIKNAFNTGDWSDALDIGTDIFEAGMAIYVGLKLADMAVTSLITAIQAAIQGSAFIAKLSGMSALAGPAALGLMSLGVQLIEWSNDKGKTWQDVGKNIAAALAAGLGIGSFTGSPQAGVLAFTLALNLELGEKADSLGEKIKEQFLDLPLFPSFMENNPAMRDVLDWNLDGNADQVKPHMATGGYISGAGTSTSDSIPAMLSDGEYIINAASTGRWRPILEAINSGNFSGFRRGGPADQRTYVPPNVANEWALKASGLGDNPALKYLAKVSKDTENFNHILDLVSGFKGMKAEYQDKMDELNNLNEELRKQIEKQLDDISGNTEEFTAGLSDLTNELSSFANNIANITGSETAGLAGNLIGSGKNMYDQFQNFGNATDMMGKITSGFGMANAALGAVSAFKSWNESRNEKAQQYWQEQLELDREQLDKINQIESNTKETTTNLIKYLSQNPTNSNIAGGRSVLDDVYNSLRGNLRPNFGQIAYNVKEEDVWFDDEETKTYNPESFLRNQMGINTPGSLSGMGLDQLQNVYDQVRNVSGSQLKSVAQDIADTMDAGWAGSGELKSWSSNFGSFKTKLGNYLNTLKDLESTLGKLQESTRLESFAGVEFLNASERVDQYRKQVEDFFKASGKSISSHQKEIDAMVNEYADKVVDGGKRIITIMRDVRSSFIQAFSGGESALDSLIGSLQPYFDTLKSNIASIFYDIELDQLDAQLKNLFGKLTDRLANYSGDNPLDFAEDILQSGSLKNVFSNIIDISKNMEDMESINDIIIEQFTDQAKAAGMTEEEIDNLLEKMGLLNDESKEITQQMQEVKNALSDAMDAALESEDLFDFRTALGESIYESAKDGLIQAFMESEVYQEMFSKWFDGQDINFTGNLEQDFDNMQGILDNLQDELREAGMDFDTTKVPTGDDSTGSDDYYGGSGVPEGEGGGTINNYTYEFAPHDNTFMGTDREDLYKEFLKWIKDKEDDEA